MEFKSNASLCVIVTDRNKIFNIRNTGVTLEKVKLIE